MEQNTNTTTDFKIYYNGNISRSYEAKKLASRTLRYTGKACAAVIHGIDIWCEAYQKDFC